MSKKASETISLKNGMDSGDVTPKTKNNLLAKQLVICAAPKCDERIHANKTRLGECAHIIPRKVGSHPREDYSTPLEDRKKEENLFYLCEKHHKLIDNPDLADQYPAEILFEWKRQHEAWASEVKKSNHYLSEGMQKNILDAIGNIGQQSQNARDLISRLFSECRNKIFNGLYDDANVILAQANLLMQDEDKDFVQESSVLEAMLEYRAERVHIAKSKLLQIIKNDTEAYDAMIEYVDICEAAPEEGDMAKKYELIVRHIDPNNSRFFGLDLMRISKSQEEAKKNSDLEIPDLKGDPQEIRLLIQKSILLDIAGEASKRDDSLEILKNKFPSSPRYHLFKFIFNSMDVLRMEPSKDRLMSCLEYMEVEKKYAESKSPITQRDQLAWYYHELLVRGELLHLYGVSFQIEQLTENIFELILSSFADKNLIAMLGDITRFTIVPENYYEDFLNHMKVSKVFKPDSFYEQMLVIGLFYPEKKQALEEFLSETGNKKLLELLKNITQRELSKTIDVLDNFNDVFKISILHSISDKDFASNIASKLQIEGEQKQNFEFLKIKIFAETNQPERAIKSITDLDINLLTPIALEQLSDISYHNQEWRLFIFITQKLFPLIEDEKRKTDLIARLAFACSKEGDDDKTIEYSELALDKQEHLLKENIKLLIWICSESYFSTGDVKSAYELFSRYDVKPSFELKLKEAEYLLKTDVKNKLEKATALALEGLKLAERFEDRLFVSVFEVINEISNAQENLGLETVTEGAYLKIEGVGWAYIGSSENSLGAIPVQSGANFDAVIGKKLGDEISWPPDAYGQNDVKRKVIFLLNEIGYLSARAQEGMNNLAMQGNDPIWSIQVIREDGTFDIENLTSFLEGQNKGRNDFFDKYKDGNVPFGFLAATEGDIGSAIAKISNQKQGFIKINNGSVQHIQQQLQSSSEVLNGKQCVIDGLSAVVLAEAGLMPLIVEKIPQLAVPISVISYLRKLALKVSPNCSSIGRGAIVKGELRFTDSTEIKGSGLYQNLIEAANLLSKQDNRTIGALIKNGNDDLLDIVPECLKDPIYIAESSGSFLLSDDYFMLEAFELVEKKKAPQNLSSYALVKTLLTTNAITQKEFLEFYSLLLSYRFHFLPVNVDDMIQAVLTPVSTGLIEPNPEYIEYFRLGLTMSHEYGVEDEVSIRVMNSFFHHLIMDDTIPDDVADTIFSYSIVRYFEGRNVYINSEVMTSVAQKLIENSHFVSHAAKRKFKILKTQLNSIAQTKEDLLLLRNPKLLKTIN
ncbi:MAG: hypothetical protein ACRBB3_08415 [Alphaproteobacteria bacterium]